MKSPLTLEVDVSVGVDIQLLQDLLQLSFLETGEYSYRAEFIESFAE